MVWPKMACFCRASWNQRQRLKRLTCWMSVSAAKSPSMCASDCTTHSNREATTDSFVVVSHWPRVAALQLPQIRNRLPSLLFIV